MLSIILILLLAASAASIETQQVDESPQIAPPPCKTVSTWLAEHNSTTIPGDLAVNCLVSIPLNVEKAQLLHDSVRPYVKWQSTLPYVKNPPEGYQMPPFDFWTAFDAIGMKISSGSYRGEHQFGLELMEVFAKVHDSHFSFVPDIVGKIFQFRRGVALISISATSDPDRLPEIYVKSDLYSLEEMPSPVVGINDRTVHDYLTKMMALSPSQDLDAQYNDLFWTSAGQFGEDGLRNEGSFVTSLVSGQYPPDHMHTRVQFKNGTTRHFYGHAELLVDPSTFAKVEDSQSFYNTFCAGKVLTLGRPAEAAEPLPPVTPPPNNFYPKAIFEHSRGHFSGYFLKLDLQRIAVLRISSFCEADNVADQAEFQTKVAQFLYAAGAANMSLLMIDLRSNSGGSAAVAYDTFMQLFPDLQPWGLDNIRAFDTLKTIRQRITELSGSSGMSLESGIYRAATRSVFQGPDLVNSTTVANWPDIFNGPSALHADSFASMVGDNLSMPEINGKDGIHVGQYFVRKADREPFFKSENMMMVTDGLCGDMCAAFSDLLRFQGRVQAIAVGGGPRDAPFEDPMPYVGLTKGPVAMTFDDIWLTTQYALNSADQDTLSHWNETTPDMFALNREPVLRGVGRGGGSVNVRDGVIPASLTDQSKDSAPFQFTVTPADCQIWINAWMAISPIGMWTAVWQAFSANEDVTCNFGQI